jgi:TRAP-type C4-dicarboxylate transport system permease small subunit
MFLWLIFVGRVIGYREFFVFLIRLELVWGLMPLRNQSVTNIEHKHCNIALFMSFML